MKKKRNSIITSIYIITLISILYTVWCEYDINKFYDSYNFKPLIEDISINGETQSYSFNVDYSGTYSVGVYFQRIIDYDIIYNSTLDKNLSFDWEIKDSTPQIITNNKLEKHRNYHSHTTKLFYKIIGQVEFPSTGPHTLTITPNKTDTILNRTNPQVIIKCIDSNYKGYGWKSLIPLIMSIIFIIISVMSFLIDRFYFQRKK